MRQDSALHPPLREHCFEVSGSPPSGSIISEAVFGPRHAERRVRESEFGPRHAERRVRRECGRTSLYRRSARRGFRGGSAGILVYEIHGNFILLSEIHVTHSGLAMPNVESSDITFGLHSVDRRPADPPDLRDRVRTSLYRRSALQALRGRMWASRLRALQRPPPRIRDPRDAFRIRSAEHRVLRERFRIPRGRTSARPRPRSPRGRSTFAVLTVEITENAFGLFRKGIFGVFNRLLAGSEQRF